ncbi:hypothetical protein BDQ17DRAFT_202955 [Cyathus striatus]|nr:hypothetical protein BDQ17DRAFT_202955 [Cyathus striatus]
MPELTQTIKFPAELASKILWSPNIDEGSGRNSQTSYVLIAHDSKDRVASPTVGDLALEKKEVSVLETKISNLSAEPGPPAIDGQTTTVVEANETAAEAVPADDSSNDEGTPSQDEHVIPILPDSIREEMKAYTSYKFSVDIQMESVKGHNDFYTEKKQSWHMDKKKIVEPVVHLYCPHAECHEVIDEAVRDIAKHEGAEVLTLDALELASGENSILGDRK